ncbi:TIGR03773 family transporter-associated surface protein [Streptomyces malaysiensis]|uniref:TIGR03773 family transporter-associated surface protein n=1 Tax=Streptomyces malaysiensis TaxID=92644 RepID=UPI00340B033D
MNTTTMRTGARASALALLVAWTPALSAAAESPAPGAGAEAMPDTGTGRTVIADGHVDIGPRFDHGRWTVQIRDDTTNPATWRETADVVLHVKDTAKIEVPESKEFGFLGTPGDPVWLLPQVQQAGVLWPGWNSQEPEVAASVDREVNWRLTSVKGPGDFVLFLNGSFGTPKILFDGRKELPQETGIEVNSHVHGNWAFTEPGTYLLDVRMSAKTKDGKSHRSERTLRFSVGPQDPRRAFVAKSPAEKRTTPPIDADTAEPSDTNGPAAPLWWGAGVAAAVVAVAATLTWRRGRNRGRTAPSRAENAAREEGEGQ